MEQQYLGKPVSELATDLMPNVGKPGVPIDNKSERNICYFNVKRSKVTMPPLQTITGVPFDPRGRDNLTPKVFAEESKYNPEWYIPAEH